MTGISGRRRPLRQRRNCGRFNPDITVKVIDTTIDKTNVARLVGSSSGIVDAMDNFPTRYLLNETAVHKKIPLFHGAIRGLYGQATTIIPDVTPCLQCIFPKAPPKEVFPVVGVTPGLIGMIAGHRGDQVPDPRWQAADRPSPHLGRS